MMVSLRARGRIQARRVRVRAVGPPVALSPRVFAGAAARVLRAAVGDAGEAGEGALRDAAGEGGGDAVAQVALGRGRALRREAGGWVDAVSVMGEIKLITGWLMVSLRMRHRIGEGGRSPARRAL